MDCDEAKLPEYALENRDSVMYSAQDCLNLIEHLVSEKKLKNEYYDTFEVEQLFKSFLRSV